MSSLWRNLTRSTAAFSPFCAGAKLSSLQLRQALVHDRETSVFSVNFSRKYSEKRFNVPPSAEFVARVSGIPTMAKLPFQESTDGLDAAFVGVPIDTGTSNRPGARCFVTEILWHYLLEIQNVTLQDSI